MVICWTSTLVLAWNDDILLYCCALGKHSYGSRYVLGNRTFDFQQLTSYRVFSRSHWKLSYEGDWNQGCFRISDCSEMERRLHYTLQCFRIQTSRQQIQIQCSERIVSHRRCSRSCSIECRGASWTPSSSPRGTRGGYKLYAIRCYSRYRQRHFIVCAVDEREGIAARC